MLPALAWVWRHVPLVAAADRLAGVAFSLVLAVITTPVSQLLVLGGLSVICFFKYLVKYGLTVAQQLTGGEQLPAALHTPKVTDQDLVLEYVRKGVSAAHVWSFVPGVDAVRPDDSAFDGLAAVGYPFKAHYFTCFGLRVHYLDEQSTAPGSCAGTLLLLHGNPTWSFLYRNMIPNLAAAGYRVVALDFFGFGKSDKLIQDSDISTEFHATTVVALMDHLQLEDVTLVMHDWGAIFMQWCLPWLPTERISRMVLLNTALPPHILFREFGLANALLVAIWQLAVMLVGRYIQATLVMKTMIPSLPLPVALGYGAPFPNHTHKAAVVRAPRLGACAIMSAGMLTQIRETQLVKVLEAAVPSLSDVLDTNARNLARGEKARAFIRKVWKKPTLLLLGAPDPLFGSVQERFAGQIYNATALGYRRTPIFIKGAGHYLPETQPGRTAADVIKFLRNT